MSEALHLIQKLNSQDRIYLETYFAGAPFWLMEGFQAVRLPGNKTFITEGKRQQIYAFLGSIEESNSILVPEVLAFAYGTRNQLI